MSGKQLQDAIVDCARRQGWRAMHVPRARPRGDVWTTPVAYDGKGWPDLTLVRAGDRVIFVEVKGDGDTLRYEQEEWIERLRAAGGEAHIWTKKEWNDGTVDRVLR